MLLMVMHTRDGTEDNHMQMSLEEV